MFLAALQQQNPALIASSLALWQQGKLKPDTYVIDVDQLLANARLILTKAQQHGLKVYAMSKQLGHNPWICQQLLNLGFDGIVAVDFKEVAQLYRHQIPVAHIGHLVQPPLHMLPQIIANKPQVITVYSIEKAQQISKIAQQYNYIQPLLLKVYQSGDLLYPVQEAGFDLNQLDDIISTLQSLAGIKIVGATHFPCMLFNADSKKTLPTANLITLLQSKQLLENHNILVEQINAPSASSCETIPTLAKMGVTHIEPGHALTGTTPANQEGNQPEKVAMLYLSEVSHHFAGNSYFFAGGYYRRGNLKNASVWDGQHWQLAEVLPMDQSSIDYYLCLKEQYPISSPLICSFRTQIFVTRSDVALVSNVASGNPNLIAIYDSLGRRYE